MKMNRLISQLSAKNMQHKEQLKNNANWRLILKVYTTAQQKDAAAVSGGGDMSSKGHVCLLSACSGPAKVSAPPWSGTCLAPPHPYFSVLFISGRNKTHLALGFYLVEYHGLIKVFWSVSKAVFSGCHKSYVFWRMPRLLSLYPVSLCIHALKVHLYFKVHYLTVLI